MRTNLVIFRNNLNNKKKELINYNRNKYKELIIKIRIKMM